MKKFIRSKKFIVSALSAACICILAACLFVNRGQRNEFKPEETTPTTTNEEWQETSPPTSALAKETSAADIPKETETVEAYPQVVKESVGESTTEVVIDFTPTTAAKQTIQETPPPAPEGKTIIEDPGPEHPVNPALEVTAPPEETPASTEPVPGSSNGNGAIYDLVFGWVVPGEVQSSTISSDGDPNKMVGNMGN